MIQQEQPRFGRVRLEEATSAELMSILWEERERCLLGKSRAGSEKEKDFFRYRLRVITRIWKETSRMMDELGWERP
jgi:hypothetical protein